MCQEMSLWERMQKSEFNPFVETDLSDEQRLTSRDIQFAERRTQRERDRNLAMFVASAYANDKVCAICYVGCQEPRLINEKIVELLGESR